MKARIFISGILIMVGVAIPFFAPAGSWIFSKIGLSGYAVSTDSSRISSLSSLCKVWGFLKYYHPAVATGEIDWDKELIARIRTEIEGTAAASFLLEMNAWIDELGPFESSTTLSLDSASIRAYPFLSWINDNSIDENLRVRLRKVSKARRATSNFYATYQDFPSAMFTNERSYESTRYPAVEYRLLGLFRYWNCINYFYPYRYNLDEWDQVLSEFIPKFIGASDELEYNLTFLELVTRIQDSHASLPSRALEKFKGRFIVPAEITFVEERAVVTGFLEGFDSQSVGLQIGDVIESINNRTVDRIVKEQNAYIPASNQAVKLREVAWDLLRGDQPQFHVSFRRDGDGGTQILKGVDRVNVNVYERVDSRKDTCFALLKPGVAYVFPWTLKEEYLPKILQSVVDARVVIIDLRVAPILSLQPLLDSLIHPPIPFVKISQGSVELPGLFRDMYELSIGSLTKTKFKGRIIILNNEYTQSSAEFSTMAAQASERVTVLGSTTAGAFGSVSSLALPGGLSTFFTGAGTYYPNGRETQRVGVLIDVEVRPTIKGISAGRDELIEAALLMIGN